MTITLLFRNNLCICEEYLRVFMDSQSRIRGNRELRRIPTCTTHNFSKRI